MILCSAIHIDDGNNWHHQPKNINTGFVVCGRRHHNCIATKNILGFSNKNHPHIQGFLTVDDKFVDREEAAQIAYQQLQIENKKQKLFSEDLY